MLGLVSAEPKYKLTCLLLGHQRAFYRWNGMRLPWCVTCKEKEESDEAQV